MIENKVNWLKHRKNFKLKNLSYIKNSTVKTIRSTRIRVHKQISFSLEDPLLYKAGSTPGEEVD